MSDFDDVVEHEKKAIVATNGHDGRWIWHPSSPQGVRERDKALRESADPSIAILGSVAGVPMALFGGVALTDYVADPIGFTVSAIGSVASLVCSVRYHRRNVRRQQDFLAQHPDVRLTLPGRAADAWDAWTTANRKLKGMDISDETREALVATEAVMKDLAVAAATMYAKGLHTGPAGVRLLEEMVRHGAETRALLGIAREREQLFAGINVDELMARATQTSITAAAHTVAADIRELAAILDGPTRPDQHPDPLDASLTRELAAHQTYALEARS